MTPGSWVVNWTQYVIPLASAGPRTVMAQGCAVGSVPGMGSGTGVTPDGYGMNGATHRCPRWLREPANESSARYTEPPPRLSALGSTHRPCATRKLAVAPGGLFGSPGRVQLSVQYTVASAVPAGGITPRVAKIRE